MTDDFNLTDREWSMRASRDSLKCLAIVGDMTSEWNSMVRENQMLQSQADRLDREVRDLREIVDMLTGIILGDG